MEVANAGVRAPGFRLGEMLRREGHQALERQIGAAGDNVDETAQRRLVRHAGFGILLAPVELNVHVQIASGNGRVVLQRLGDTFGIHRMHRCEGARHEAGLVALQMAHQMPYGARPHLLDLGQRLLHAVFAEQALARPHCFHHGGGGHCLADSDELHGFRQPPGSARRGGNALPDGGQIFGNGCRYGLRAFHA